MLSDKKIEEYKKNKKSSCQLNFRIKKTDKNKLDSIADKKKLTTSEIIRLLIQEFIKKQKKEGTKIV